MKKRYAIVMIAVILLAVVVELWPRRSSQLLDSKTDQMFISQPGSATKKPVVNVSTNPEIKSVSNAIKIETKTTALPCTDFFKYLLKLKTETLIELAKADKIAKPSRQCQTTPTDRFAWSWLAELPKLCADITHPENCDYQVTYLRAIALRELLGEHPDWAKLTNEQLVLYSLAAAMFDPSDRNRENANAMTSSVADELEKRNPDSWLSYEVRFANFMGQGSLLADYKSTIDRALQKFHPEGEFFDSMAQYAMMHSQKPAEMLAMLEQIPTTPSSEWQKTYFEANIAFKDGQPEKAHSILTEALKQNPSDDRVQHSLECLKSNDCKDPFSFSWSNPVLRQQ